jgi:ribose 5-phosphate isomerase B
LGACIAANKMHGMQARLILERFSTHQGIKDDDMNVICPRGRVLSEYFPLEVWSEFFSKHD